jgi:NADPH:quinone reductase-like Zn-dependent oxidoreductase
VRLARPFVLSPFVRQNLRRYLSHPNRTDLTFLTGLVEEGKLRSVIDTTYALGDVPAALRQIEAGHVRGRVVVTVADADAREEDLALSA